MVVGIVFETQASSVIRLNSLMNRGFALLEMEVPSEVLNYPISDVRERKKPLLLVRRRGF